MKAFIKGTTEDFTIGLQYSSVTRKLTIGGHINFNDKMIAILLDYFKVPVSKIRGNVSAQSKIKYIVKVHPVKFTEYYTALSRDTICTPTKRLERVWW